MRWIVSACACIGGAMFVVGGYWVNGFDFDQRGPWALGCYIFSAMIGASAFILTSTYPGWNE